MKLIFFYFFMNYILPLYNWHSIDYSKTLHNDLCWYSSLKISFKSNTEYNFCTTRVNWVYNIYFRLIFFFYYYLQINQRRFASAGLQNKYVRFYCTFFRKYPHTSSTYTNIRALYTY